MSAHPPFNGLWDDVAEAAQEVVFARCCSDVFPKQGELLHGTARVMFAAAFLNREDSAEAKRWLHSHGDRYAARIRQAWMERFHPKHPNGFALDLKRTEATSG